MSSPATHSPDVDPPLGTHDLEAGMRPSRVAALVPVMAISVALLFVFNSAGLVRWTQNLPPSPLNTALSDAANAWHDAMTAAGPARLFAAIKDSIGVDLK